MSSGLTGQNVDRLPVLERRVTRDDDALTRRDAAHDLDGDAAGVAELDNAFYGHAVHRDENQVLAAFLHDGELRDEHHAFAPIGLYLGTDERAGADICRAIDELPPSL